MTKLKYGIQIEPQFGFSFDEIKKIALAAEQNNFHSIWFSDHFFLDTDAIDKNCFDSWTILTATAVLTKKIRLGTLVTCQSYRYPSVLAKIVSTVDVISSGRIEMGIGAGWKEIEYNAYGIPFPKASIRIEQLREAIHILKKMWTEDKPSFNGKYYKIKEAINVPKPIQKPHPPIWVGGTGNKLLSVTAELADGLNFAWTLSPEKYKDRLSVLEKHCKRVNRDIDTIRKSVGLIALIENDEKTLKKRIQEEAKKRNLSVEKYLEVRKDFLIGTPETIIPKLREYKNLGIELVILMFPYQHELKSIEIVAEHIMPKL